MDVVWNGRGSLLRSVVLMTTTPRHRDQKVSAKRAILSLLVALAVALVVAGSVTSFSSASFTSRTVSAASTVQAASDWTPPTVAMQSPGATVRGTITLTATASDADSGLREVVIQQRVLGGTSWVTACTFTSGPFSCTVNSTQIASGTYDLRAVATDRADNSATSNVVRTIVDNTAPAVTMTDPGSPLSATRTFTATASDAHSGVAQVVIQHQVNGSSTWTTLCTVAASPYSCSIDTRTLADGTYSFRAVATDVAGNSTTSATVANRVVSNVVSTVTLADPGAYLFGPVTLNATASSTAGVRSVTIQRAPAGSSTWTDICVDTSSPYSCSWNTSGVDDGSYDLRAVLTDNAGRTTNSAIVSTRRVDNSPLTGIDIQTFNGGASGQPDNGDTVVYTFSRAVNLNSIVSGLSSGPVNVQARVRTNSIFSGNSLFDVPGTALGQVDLDDRYHNTLFGSTSTFNSTMTATSTVAADGTPRTVVTVRLGSLTPGSSTPLQTTINTTLTWTPSSAVTDLQGRALSVTSVTESGAADRDF